MTKPNHNFRTVRAMYRRLGIMEGNGRDGFQCLICNKEIRSTRHFTLVHESYYIKAQQILGSRSYEGVRECLAEAVQQD